MEHTPSGKQYLDPAAVLARLKLQPGMTIGDFGVGGGAYFALQAGQLVGAKGVVWAIDIYKPALSAAESQGRMSGVRNLKPLWSNLEVYRGARAIADGSLDAGILVNVLHQSKKHREILRESARMLKAGAPLLVIDWAVTGFGFGPKQEALVPEEYVMKLAVDLGLAITDRFDPSRYHYALIFTAPGPTLRTGRR